MTDESIQKPYEHTPDEVEETSDAARRYIIEGDSFDEPYDLRGLCVYGVISVVRKIDEEILDGQLVLSPSQENRLAEVDHTIDRAVEKQMQYYPFGHNDKYRTEMDGRDYAQLANKKTHGTFVPVTSLSDTKSMRRVATSSLNTSGERSGHVTVLRPEPNPE